MCISMYPLTYFLEEQAFAASCALYNQTPPLATLGTVCTTRGLSPRMF